MPSGAVHRHASLLTQRAVVFTSEDPSGVQRMHLLSTKKFLLWLVCVLGENGSGNLRDLGLYRDSSTRGSNRNLRFKFEIQVSYSL